MGHNSAPPPRRPSVFEAGALERAQAAFESSAQPFQGWLQNEIDKLAAAREAVDPAGLTSETAAAVRRRAHDLKGLGTTCQFPIVTRLARSLQRLLLDTKNSAYVPVFLIYAHVRAIQAAVRHRIRDASDPAGAELVGELERLVDMYQSARLKPADADPRPRRD